MGWSDWIRGVEIEPSLYGADFARLGEQVDELLAAGCRIFHYDVGDGHFVEPITMGPIVLEAISERIHVAGAAVDVHLMVDRPTDHFGAFAAAGADSVTFHHEVAHDVARTAAAARAHGLQAGLAFNPETEPEDVAAVAGDVDLVLCMSIHPGYSGQRFMEEAYDRIRRLRAGLPPATPIQVDGGVGPGNIAQLRDCGASLFVAASSIFGADDPAQAYRGLADAVA